MGFFYPAFVKNQETEEKPGLPDVPCPFHFQPAVAEEPGFRDPENYFQFDPS